MNLTTEQVWESFSQKLKSFILRRAPEPDEAEDILQEIFIKIHTHLPALNDEQRLAPWLYQIARNTITDRYRTRREWVELPEDLEVDPDEAPEAPLAMLARGVQGMIACIPEKYQQPVVLAELEGLKQQEVADRLGLSLSGAKSRVQRGRQMLLECLLDCCHVEFDRRGSLLDFTPRAGCCDLPGSRNTGPRGGCGDGCGGSKDVARPGSHPA